MLNPNERNEYESLIDFCSAELHGKTEQIQDSLSIRQQVKVKSWDESDDKYSFYDFYLTKCDDLWLVDVVLKK